MKLSQIGALLEAEVVVGSDVDLDIRTCCGVDLMSDALAYAKSGCLLITGLISPQTVRTAYALDVAAIMVCRGKVPTEDAIRVAQELDVPILRTCYVMFESCGRLYQAGLIGCVETVGECRRRLSA